MRTGAVELVQGAEHVEARRVAVRILARGERARFAARLAAGEVR